MSLVRLLALFSLLLAIIFYAWNVSHGRIDAMLLFFIGMFLWCLSDHDWSTGPWVRR